MKTSLKISLLIALLIVPYVCWAELNINPGSRTELLEILKGLADDHSYKQWCENNCGQIHRLRLSGSIQSGLLEMEISGHIVGQDNGVLPLFGAVPAVEILSLKSGTSEVPLVYSNKSYFTLLPPGAFLLKGQIKIDRTSSTNFMLPGAVGQIDLDIPDQEPLLKALPKGQVGGSFQIVSASKSEADTKQSKRDLRIRIEREFMIARDKTFTYRIHAVGAKAGQVILIPLTENEKVFQTEPQHARIFDDRIEFTATGSENQFSIYGEWTKPEIDLKAGSGSTQEIWQVECEGAYDCVFKGDVDKSIGVAGHQWEPKSGNALNIKWRELGVLHGQSIVAEKALLKTQHSGKAIKQSLITELKSSSSDQVFVKLPDKAIPTALRYNGTVSPVLKNDQGLIHVTVPQGNSTVTIDWEIPDFKGFRIPLPELGLPIAQWAFWVTPNANDAVIFAGGLSGSPVVLFWPRLGFCIFVGLLFLWAEKRVSGRNQTKSIVFLIVCLGLALGDAGVILILVGMLAVMRGLSAVKQQRTIFGWLLEWGLMIGLIFASFGVCFSVIDRAFFEAQPFRFDNLCSSMSILGQSMNYDDLCWESNLLPHTQMLKAPYVFTLSILAMRVFYFVWAIFAGSFFYLEFKNLWVAGVQYFSMGRKMVLKPMPKKT